MINQLHFMLYKLPLCSVYESNFSERRVGFFFIRSDGSLPSGLKGDKNRRGGLTTNAVAVIFASFSLCVECSHPLVWVLLLYILLLYVVDKARKGTIFCCFQARVCFNNLSIANFSDLKFECPLLLFPLLDIGHNS